jgi:hypothetical protein
MAIDKALFARTFLVHWTALEDWEVAQRVGSLTSMIVSHHVEVARDHHKELTSLVELNTFDHFRHLNFLLHLSL